MKTLLLSATAALALAASPALAQHDRDHHHGSDTQQSQAQMPSPHGKRGEAHRNAAMSAHSNTGAYQGRHGTFAQSNANTVNRSSNDRFDLGRIKSRQAETQSSTDNHRDRAGHYGYSHNQVGHNNYSGEHHHNNVQRYGQNNYGQHDYGDRGEHGHRYNFEHRGERGRIMRGNFQAPHHFHAGRYYGPSGWEHHHWRYGEHLPSAYFLPNFWLTNYFAFDLVAPPPGYVWVRVGDDALLVDRYTGDIVEVEYGVFD